MFRYLLDRWGGAGGGPTPQMLVLLAALSALAVVLVAGRWFIPFLQARRVLDAQQKGDAPLLEEMHAHKGSTPTLGGVLILAGILASMLLWCRVGSAPVLWLGAYVLSLGLLGLADDLKKLRTGRKGLSARGKLACQVALSLAVVIGLHASPPEVRFPAVDADGWTRLFVPLAGGASLDLGPAWMVLAVMVMAGTSNAVNLTDGLDGLAGGICVLAALPVLVISLDCADAQAGALLGLPYAPHGMEVAVFLAACCGAGLGFLWFNAHPARIFMGDTGSLALGGGLGLAAVLCRQELLLLVCGGVLVAEALSVILQVGSYKLRRKRIFLIAPLHHHFQYKKWPETRVTVRFWIAGAVLAWVSLALWQAGA